MDLDDERPPFGFFRIGFPAGPNSIRGDTLAWRIVQEWIEEFAGKLLAIVMDTVDGGDGAMMVMEIGLAVSSTHTHRVSGLN